MDFDYWKCLECGLEFGSTKDSTHVSCPRCGSESITKQEEAEK